jgi:hypothetical protein
VGRLEIDGVVAENDGNENVAIRFCQSGQFERSPVHEFLVERRTSYFFASA